jgi:hypothetical protein
MPDYKEQTIEGKSWVRAFHVDAQNPIEGAKGITYHEETAIMIGGKMITSRNGQRLQCPYGGGEGDTYNLIHPETGAVIGTMTEQMLYIAMASHYLHRANKRDAPNVPEEPTNQP